MSPWYQRYLESDEWKRTRLLKLLSAGLDNTYNVIRCQDRRCRMWFPLGFIQVHHKTYKRVGHERMSDLQVLCAGCHAYRHGKRRPGWWLELKRRNAQIITKQSIRYLRTEKHISDAMIDCLNKLASRECRLVNA